MTVVSREKGGHSYLRITDGFTRAVRTITKMIDRIAKTSQSLFVTGKESIITKFIRYKQQNKNTDGKTQGETKQVDCHVGLVLQQISSGRFQAMIDLLLLLLLLFRLNLEKLRC